jgi:hypothetical protein
MKKLLIISLVVICSSVSGSAGIEEEVYLRAAAMCYGTDEAFLRSLRRLESGRKGNEMGHESRTHLQAYGNLCMPQGSEQWGQASLAMIDAMQKFCLYQNGWYRNQFFRHWAKYYHAGGNGKNRRERAANNKHYRETLQEIFLQESGLKK